MTSKNEELEKPADKTGTKGADETKKVELKAAPEPKTADEKKTMAASKAKDKPAVSEMAASAVAGASAAARDVDVKSIAIKTAAVLVSLAALVVLVFGVLIYGYKSESPVVDQVSKVIPYPIEKVNGSFVSYHDYLFEVDANKRAYQNNAKLNNQPAVDFNSADGKKMLTQIRQHALDKLKSDAVVAQLASQKQVTVSDKEVNDLVNQLYQRYGGKDTLLKTLNQIYGWDLGDLKSVVRKQLLAQKLQEKVTSDPKADAQAKAKAQDVLKKIKDGGDFGDVAKQYSQAADASSGGDLGSVTKGQLPDDEQKAIDALQPGQVSDLVKTQYGYEIIKVNEKDGDTTKAAHILIKTVDFNDYFNGELDKAKVKTFIKVA